MITMEDVRAVIEGLVLVAATYIGNRLRKFALEVWSTWKEHIELKRSRLEHKMPAAELDQKIATAVSLLKASWDLRYGGQIPDDKRDALLTSGLNLVLRAIPGANGKRADIIAKILEAANARP